MRKLVFSSHVKPSEPRNRLCFFKWVGFLFNFSAFSFFWHILRVDYNILHLVLIPMKPILTAHILVILVLIENIFFIDYMHNKTQLIIWSFCWLPFNTSYVQYLFMTKWQSFLCIFVFTNQPPYKWCIATCNTTIQ